MAKTDSIIKMLSPAKNEEQINFIVPGRPIGYMYRKCLLPTWVEVPE